MYILQLTAIMMEGPTIKIFEARNLHNARWILFTLKVGSLTTDDLVDINFQAERESTGNKSAVLIDAKESIIE